jgi:hypothetical protein
MTTIETDKTLFYPDVTAYMSKKFLTRIARCLEAFCEIQSVMHLMLLWASAETINRQAETI